MSQPETLQPIDALPLEGVAIIGMSGRFPGAPNLEAFWRVLLDGKDTITSFSEPLPVPQADADFVAARGVLEDAEMFDADYFGISPREADMMDPQHRIFLEACSNALEDAGYVSATYPGEIGLFAGCSLNTYLLANLAKDRTFLDDLTRQYQVGEFHVALGNDKDFLTTRAAYKLNLRGPVVSVQSACATSLVAICQASQALLNFQCDMALAGGVSVTFPQERGHLYQEGGIVSKDGHCRPFDAQATGTVFGHGVGVILLKRLEDAVRDGDRICAVIRGFAVNNDGSAKAGYMAPGVDGQARVIAAAQAMAGVEPDSISLVEAHGTATPLGDPIEIAALTRVFREGTDRTAFCAVGTAKGNVGHLDAAAGVTGVIKTVLSMQHSTIPALAHFTQPNPAIDLTDSPFYFSPAAKTWESKRPLRAGVSAFGVGGVNAHVVLEEAPHHAQAASPRVEHLFCISARTHSAAIRAAANLADHLERHSSQPLEDAAYTLALGRKTHEFRLAVTGGSCADAARRLRSAAAAGNAATTRNGVGRRVAFQFSGQGSQFVGMGHVLYRAEPLYRRVVDECCQVVRPLLGSDLRDVLYASPDDADAAARLDQTGLAQPALFITEFALATLWQSWGIVPEAMVGHSLGEYVAATLAGVMTRDEALRLVCLRARLMQALPSGAMLSVAIDESGAAKYIATDLALAAVNSSHAVVLAGPTPSIEALERQLAQDGIASRRLRTSHAFHSAMMDPMLAEFEAEVARVSLRAPQTRFVSSVTGRWITSAEATDPAYWARQCRQPVQFAAAIRCLLTDGINLLLEVGPGKTLTTLAARQASAAGASHSVATIASFTNATGPDATMTNSPASVQDALAKLWTAGCEVDWHAFYAHESRLRTSLPTYPFERKRHWVEPPANVPRASTPLDVPNEIALMSTATILTLSETPDLALAPSRTDRLRVEIASVLTELSGITTTQEEADHQFLELGFDSLFLTQATQSLQKRFGVKVTFRQLMEQFSSIATLADHLDAILPPQAFAAVAPAPAAQPPLASSAGAAEPRTHANTTPVDRLFADQLATLSQLFADQVTALRAAAGSLPAPASPMPTVIIAPAATAEAAEVRHGSFRPVHAKAQQDLDEKQLQYIAQLIARYETKTPGSKRATQTGRGCLADPRAVAGFRPQWKEMVYPLLVERARGSRLWDVDGNEYIDIVNGYGCIMFGHSPQFVLDAIREQLERGVAIGPQSPLAGEVAEMICELTGNERVTFCNTGSEAVMAAIRVARTVTGRDKVVYFAGDYHGTFDEVLIRNTPRGSAPVAPGIPLANVTNVVVLEYGTEASLDYLRAHGDEIAAVLIEPVQTRNPGLQPIDFIRAIRLITEQAGSAMILDEVVTGFRLAPGGVQEAYGIRADMCTYGKVIGGGHPIGVLSGKRAYLDALDGGAWQFGDDSGPEVGVTFFAGTFVRHPLALAAAKSVLEHLKQAGPALQSDLNAKTAKLAESLDRFFVERGVPSRVHHFASWFYFTFSHDARLGSLLYYAMRAKGIHIQEGYPCFLTTAHSESDLVAVEAAFRDTILEMQAAGVLPGGPCSCEAVAVAPGLHPEAIETAPAEVALTEPQREVFFAAALNDEANCAFNESLTLHLHGVVNERSLEAAIQSVIARHDALRSTINEGGEYLRVAPTASFAMATVDLRGLERSQQDHVFAAAIEEEAGTPFDLARGPLLRAVCYRMADDHVSLLLTAHHIVLDGWSANQLLEEVGKFYSNRPLSEFAPLLPFSSYALREQEREKKGEFIANEVYWVNRFDGRSPRLDLPTDSPRPEQKSYRGRSFEGVVSPEIYAELKKASARAGCSLYVTLLSAFQVLMHRLSLQDEVVVGISTAGQALVENGSLIGHCVHFLPMLSQLTGAMTAGEHLRATKTALLDAYDHQEFTYGSLLRKLKLDREPGRLPLIEVQFNLERVGTNVVFDGLAVDIHSNPKRFVNTDLFLNVVETGADLRFMCDYNSDLFHQETPARWMESWVAILQHLSASPTTRLDALTILGVSEREQLVSGWNSTGVDFGAFAPMHASFLARAEQEPGRIALECGGRVWTYAELSSYARMLARRLRSEGLQPGGLVAICLDRSPEMVGAVLAVMLAGGAYVPLDPRHPQERLEMVLTDSGAQLLLTSLSLGLRTQARTIDLSTPVDTGAADFTPAEPAPDSLAYVIYTSGSTGRPKGVAIEHGALTNLLRSMQRQPGLDQHDVLVAITTLAFDIAGLELLLPLMTGAKLVVATDAEVQDGRLLLALLQRTRATVLQATPGAWRILIDAGWSNTPPLKALCGGEALPRELADKLLDRAAEVWNMYGPTETTIWSSATRVTAGTASVPVGPPIANTQFYLLDPHLQPVPIGVTAELFIAGQGLARGYWNQPELTTQKFIPNPFGPGRLYRTGDLARFRDDGSIELLGRADFQVKIRGYRIELAEIEAAILKHTAAKDTVVTAHRAEGVASRRLAAYIEGSAADASSLQRELTEMLRRSLPEYMVPSSFTVLDKLPRTANGKIDRKALPEPSSISTAENVGRSFTPATTPAQKLLAAIWAEVLELNAVSVTDSIFELGADSLLIFRIAARAQREGLPVNPTLIFQRRTIARVCEALDQQKLEAPVRVTTRITAASREQYRLPVQNIDRADRIDA